MTNAYDDILRLPHPTSERHPRMPVRDRAAIFSPFAALTGHGAAIAETARLTQRRVELDEDAGAELDRKLQILAEAIAERPEAAITWFRPDGRKEGGSYVTSTGRLKKVDRVERTVVLADGTKIPLDDILNMESEYFPDVTREDI